MSRKIRVAALVLLSLTLLCAMGGCKKKPALVVKPPVETTETVEVPPPPEPVLWPFTGLESADASAVLNRPISVKIENSALARPQMGLNHADVIYETIAEGGITRFNLIFQSDIPKEIGPVRSARLSDMWIVPQYGNGLFFYSGSNSQVSKRIKKHKLANLSHGKVGTAMYHRVSFRHAPHNLYLDLNKAYKTAKKKKFAVVEDATIPGLTFGESVHSSEVTATSVTIPFSANFKMKWSWDAEKAVYKRSTNGKKQTDAIDKSRVTATNVVVLWAKYTKQGKKDPAGNGTYDINLGGEGKCAVFRDGKRIDGTWKADRSAPPKFYDETSTEVTLNPGRTWFEVPPTDIKIKSK
ncbi:MAG: DUF3048 domain-containing protein [Actinomycetes bacterium]|nr:DUF3048 domain-containing protein [Actinomycetes bacterium]